METSAATFTKHPRPHYKSLYTTTVSLNDRLRGELREMTDWRNLEVQMHELTKAQASRVANDLLASSTSRNRWAIAAIVEAAALIAVALILWLR